VIIDRFARDLQLFWVYGRYTELHQSAVTMPVTGIKIEANLPAPARVW
jgi:hypothetical protein